MKKILSILCVSVALTGCTQLDFLKGQQQHSSMSRDYYAQPKKSYAPQQVAPRQMAQPVQQQAPVFVRQGGMETATKVNNLMERVRRVERAMLRLDRRMQLIERNELSRMSSGVMSGGAAAEPQGQFQPMSYGAPQIQKQPLQQLPSIERPYARQQPISSRGGYRPVSYKGERITSSLGVAHKTKALTTSNVQANTFSGMPSLADNNSNGHNANKSSVSIWTINYESGKVWPGREQLISSREVVKALTGKKPAALYARGARPASKEFRERVRAVSKYLSKVTRLESVPIASMPAKHMKGDTIEIIVTK